jgi:hypothetical protein
MQTIYNLLIIGLICMLINETFIINPLWRPLLYSFWVGQALLYLINYAAYRDDVDTWINNFNNYTLLAPVYVASILAGLIFVKK